MKKVLALLMVIGIFGAFMAGCSSKPAEEGGATAGAGADATKPAEGEAGK